MAARRAHAKARMMIEFEHTITIDRPIDEVFAFLSDFQNVPKWNYFVHDVSKMTHGKVAVGTAYHQVRRRDEQDFRVTEFEPPHIVAVKTLPDSSPQFERRFTLQADGKATRVLDEWKLDTGIPNLIQRFAAGKVKSAVAENLEKLKQLLETGSVVLQDGRRVTL